jgi:hypothetical protein
MRIPFMAFAEDAVVHGELLLEGERLSDFIAQDSPFRIESVVIEALDDGRTVEVSATTIARDDLVAITGSGPRGNPARRLRTRQYPARAQAGPYEIVGYVHATPSAHPFAGVVRRQVLPMTSAVIRYRIADRSAEWSCDALLVNPAKVDWLENASDQALRLGPVLELSQKLDSRAKDMTGELRA